MEINQIYVNLPTKDLKKTRAFWTKLGFAINEQFSDDKAIMVVLKEGQIYVMFLVEEFFQTFTNRPVAKGDTTQTLLCIELASKENVDEMIQTALENDGASYNETRDYGWMYQRSFSDIDGHQWEVIYSDMSKFPGQEQE